MKLEYVKLNDEQVRNGLHKIHGWLVRDGKLCKSFKFDTYKGGVVFASAVGYAADKLNHHPDMTVSYGKVTVCVSTHDVGGLSPYDFELARIVDELH